MYLKHSLTLENDLFNNEHLLYNKLYSVISWCKCTLAYCSTCRY